MPVIAWSTTRDPGAEQYVTLPKESPLILPGLKAGVSQQASSCVRHLAAPLWSSHSLSNIKHQNMKYQRLSDPLVSMTMTVE
ncbi:hypothetical protein MHYP_G00145000 [Metynnis hypsauchen]